MVANPRGPNHPVKAIVGNVAPEPMSDKATGTIRTALHGAETAKYREGEDEYDIVVRYLPTFRQKVEDIENATIFYEGEAIPVSAFATPEFGTSLASISRIDGERVVTVSADVGPDYNAAALLSQIQASLADFPLPAGYRLTYTGESEDQAEAEEFLSEAFADHGRGQRQTTRRASD